MEERLKNLQSRLEHLQEGFKTDELRRRMGEVEAEMGRVGFWDNPEAAQETVAQLKQIKATLDPLEALCRAFEDAEAMAELASESGETTEQAEAETHLAELERQVDRMEFKAMLTGPHDHRNAFLRIHAGAGGTESCDWAAMLIRMYTRWMERNGYEAQIYEQTHGEEAGTRSITLLAKGAWVYGYLRAEIGVHRLVRISPFDAQSRRHTSFASVDVVPEIDDEISVEFSESELRVDTYRASGPGGQHVNKTSSAVRITHIPTGIVVACQSERSQHKNRATCLKLLRAKLYRQEELKREKELASLYGEKGEIAWGNQIRSYVLQPYTMVKDHRTLLQSSNTTAVLDGEIDAFIEAYLKQAIGK